MNNKIFGFMVKVFVDFSRLKIACGLTSNLFFPFALASAQTVIPFSTRFSQIAMPTADDAPNEAIKRLLSWSPNILRFSLTCYDAHSTVPLVHFDLKLFDTAADAKLDGREVRCHWLVIEFNSEFILKFFLNILWVGRPLSDWIKMRNKNKFISS